MPSKNKTSKCQLVYITRIHKCHTNAEWGLEEHTRKSSWRVLQATLLGRCGVNTFLITARPTCNWTGSEFKKRCDEDPWSWRNLKPSFCQCAIRHTFGKDENRQCRPVNWRCKSISSTIVSQRTPTLWPTPHKRLYRVCWRQVHPALLAETDLIATIWNWHWMTGFTVALTRWWACTSECN